MRAVDSKESECEAKGTRRVRPMVRAPRKRSPPDEIRVRRVRVGACNATVEALVEAVVALTRAWRLPVKVGHLLHTAEQLGGLGLHLAKRWGRRHEVVPCIAARVDLEFKSEIFGGDNALTGATSFGRPASVTFCGAIIPVGICRA